jgi:hypothetical protein
MAAIPPALRDLLEPGVDVRARWNAAIVQARRNVVRALMVKVASSGRNAFVLVRSPPGPLPVVW